MSCGGAIGAFTLASDGGGGGANTAGFSSTFRAGLASGGGGGGGVDTLDDVGEASDGGGGGANTADFASTFGVARVGGGGVTSATGVRDPELLLESPIFVDLLAPTFTKDPLLVLPVTLGTLPESPLRGDTQSPDPVRGGDFEPPELTLPLLVLPDDLDKAGLADPEVRATFDEEFFLVFCSFLCSNKHRECNI